MPEREYFPLDELLISWGTTQDEVLALAPARHWHHDNSGWFASISSCQSVAGLAATACRLGGPALWKPVLRVEYTLDVAPLAQDNSQVLTIWLAPLSALLGLPTEIKPLPNPDQLAAGNPLFWAVWQFPTYRATLSAYRFDRGNAPLFEGNFRLEWQDALTAAQPFLAPWQAQKQLLNTAVIQDTDLLLTNLQEQQPGYGAPATNEAEAQLEEANWALKYHDLYPTPGHVRGRLENHQVALWQVTNSDVWAVSTRTSTAVLNRLNSAGAIELTNVHPAKGPGNTVLRVGELRLYDAYQSLPLQQLTASLETKLAVTAVHSQGHDY